MTPSYINSTQMDAVLGSDLQHQSGERGETSRSHLKAAAMLGGPLSSYKFHSANVSPHQDNYQARDNDLTVHDLIVAAGPVCKARLDVQGEVIMRSGKSLLGLTIICQEDGVRLGRVRDLIFSQETGQVVALVLGIGSKELSDLAEAAIIPWQEIVTLGKYSIAVKSAASKMKLSAYEPACKATKEGATLLSGTEILTSEGINLGTLADMCIDEETGQVTGYEVSTGFIADTLQDKQFRSASSALIGG